MNTERTHDVAVVGGGAAGLSAAVTLARSLRSVVVIDDGTPRNAPAAGAHNVLGREGIGPLELLAAGRREAAQYGAQFRAAAAVAARRLGNEFEIDLSGGETVRVRRLVLATGLADELPDVPGLREGWGRSVLHCPYCHGWEVRGQRIGVLATGERSTHQALLFRQLSENVTLFLHELAGLPADVHEQLLARDVRVVSGGVQRIRGADGAVHGVVLDDGREFAVDAVVVAPRFLARAAVYEQLGGTLTDHPLGRFIETDPTGRTGVAGVWAAGNVSDLAAVVAVAAGAGTTAGAAVNADLVAEEVASAVRERAALAGR